MPQEEGEILAMRSSDAAVPKMTLGRTCYSCRTVVIAVFFCFAVICFNYTSAHGSGRRYSILLVKFLSLFFLNFFSFANGSPRWLYRQGTFLAQMVGYRCNFKNWVQNLGGDPPLKFGGGPQTPQCCDPKSEDAVQTYSRNRPRERLSKTGFKILGAPPPKKKI